MNFQANHVVFFPSRRKRRTATNFSPPEPQLLTAATQRSDPSRSPPAPRYLSAAPGPAALTAPPPTPLSPRSAQPSRRRRYLLRRPGAPAPRRLLLRRPTTWRRGRGPPAVLGGGGRGLRAPPGARVGVVPHRELWVPRTRPVKLTEERRSSEAPSVATPLTLTSSRPLGTV